MLKLSQGEYVATEAVEAVFSECSWVAQIFVYGNSFENCLVAVAAPNPDVVIPAIRALDVEVKNVGEEGWKDSLARACLDPRVVKKVMEELDAYGKRMGLNGFEMIKGLFLDGHVGPMNQIFTVDNGMMTPTFKLKRNVCQQHYEKEIAAMYDAIHKQNSSVCCNKDGTSYST